MLLELNWFESPGLSLKFTGIFKYFLCVFLVFCLQAGCPIHTRKGTKEGKHQLMRQPCLLLFIGKLRLFKKLPSRPPLLVTWPPAAEGEARREIPHN